MITKISHIGIAVKDLKFAADTYKKLLNSEPSAVEYVEGQKVNVIKFKVGESVIELLEGSAPDSPISKFIEKRGEGIHHIGYESDNIINELLRIGESGFELINIEPVTGSDKMQIAFIKPKSTIGVLTEICQH
jgi:methylmalonyl-CoA/ethylmalonyl-CoA epimerase